MSEFMDKFLGNHLVLEANNSTSVPCNPIEVIEEVNNSTSVPCNLIEVIEEVNNSTSVSSNPIEIKPNPIEVIEEVNSWFYYWPAALSGTVIAGAMTIKMLKNKIDSFFVKVKASLPRLEDVDNNSHSDKQS